MRCTSGNLRARRGGQVLVIAIIGMTLLVALVFYVYNIGDQVNDRLAMQNAADSAAVSGAGWIARSMNTTAMNNLAMTRLIALVPIFDAFPLASRIAYEEVDAWVTGIDTQVKALEAYLSGHPEPALKQSLPGMKELSRRMAGQGEIIRPFHEALNSGSFSMDEVTFWRAPGFAGPAPHGSFWRAAVALEDYSQATLDSAGVLAQYNAQRFGGTRDAQTVVLIPVVPKIPNHRGTLDDFQPPIEGRITVRTGSSGSWGRMERTGGDGGAIPDYAYHHRLGPWARLIPWRYKHTHQVKVSGEAQVREKIPGTEKREKYWVPPRPGRRAVQTRGGKPPLPGRGSTARRGGSAGSGGTDGHWAYRSTWQYRTVTKTVDRYISVVDGYSTYGPYKWALNLVQAHAGKHLPDLRFRDYVKRIADIKLDYMFPAAGPKILQTVYYPTWITNYDEAKAMADQPETRVAETMLYFFDIASSAPENSPQFLSPGTYRTNGSLALASRKSGYHEAATFDGLRGDAKKICDHIWKSTDWYETTEDPEIGIHYQGPGGIDPETGEPRMEPVWHKVYVIEYCMFGAIDVGGDWEVRNPCNWQADEVDDLPAPFLLDTSVGDYDSQHTDVDNDYRREFFGFLSLARRGTAAAVWPARFRGVNPTKAIITFAQAKVFNNSSWGLWTQDWQVQLAPVSFYADWVDRIAHDVGNVSGTRGSVNAAELGDILEYLQALSPEMADQFLGH